MADLVNDIVLNLGAVAEVKGKRISELGTKLVNNFMLDQKYDPAIIDIIEQSIRDALDALMALRAAQTTEKS